MAGMLTIADQTPFVILLLS